MIATLAALLSAWAPWWWPAPTVLGGIYWAGAVIHWACDRGGMG